MEEIALIERARIFEHVGRDKKVDIFSFAMGNNFQILGTTEYD